MTLAGMKLPRQPISTEEATRRFMSKVEVSGSECWQWAGNLRRRGYGRFQVNRVVYVASRWSFARFIRPIGPDEVVCHHCDNPGCVNPEHLFAGSQGDNVRDCMAKGRHPRSPLVRSHCSKGHELTQENIVSAKWGKQCRVCANDRKRSRYRDDPTFREHILTRNRNYNKGRAL